MNPLFNISNWTRLEKTIEQKHNVLLSLFSILGIVTAGLQIVIDGTSGMYLSACIDGTIVISMMVTYYLNEKRKHLLAKLLFVSLLNFILFVYASISPKEAGVYFYFFPVIGVTALIFDNTTRTLRNLFVAIPIIFVIILEISNYQLFGDINIQEGIDDPYSFPVNISISMLVTMVSIYQLMLINRAIDQKRMVVENELKTKNEDLEKSNKELDHFAYSASHDLKAPLSSISGLINIAKMEVKEEKAHEYFDMINSRVDKLNLFIKDIIDLSKNSRLDLVKEDVDITQVVNNAIENNKYMENAESIEFKIKTPAEGVFQLDRARLEVVLNNLISNAIKYHKKSGDRWVDISVEKIKSNLNITIKDNGIGIGKDQQSKVFEMFYRGHHISEGSGLGLYIVSDVINKMNGGVILTSKEEVGTEIDITLPIG